MNPISNLCGPVVGSGLLANHLAQQQAALDSLRYGMLCTPQPKAIEKPKEEKVKMLRSYLDKHRDVLFTLGIIIVIDHFVLGGTLRHRIQEVLEAALDRISHLVGVMHKVEGGNEK